MVVKWLLTDPNNSYYLTKNFTHVFMWMIALVFFTKFSYSYFEKWNRIILAWVLAVMLIVLIIGKEYNGARWWLDIPGLPSIQPVEFAKVGIILFLASFMKKKRSLIASLEDGTIPYFLIVGALFMLLALQPDFGSILILAPVLLALYFVWWGNMKHIALLFLIGAIGAWSIYGIWKLWDNNSKLSYISSRIDSFFQDNETLFSKTDTDGKDYQIKQWLIAIGSGGFGWLGFGKSIQKFGYLPEVQWDFIFSVIVEELWFMGALSLMILFFIITYRGYVIARSVKDLFGKYVAFWLSTLILVQVFVNIGVNLNVVPLTGVTLPFVSYGGSSLIALMISIWILLNISRHMEYNIPSSLSQSFHKKRRVY